MFITFFACACAVLLHVFERADATVSAECLPAQRKAHLESTKRHAVQRRSIFMWTRCIRSIVAARSLVTASTLNAYYLYKYSICVDLAVELVGEALDEAVERHAGL
jgi:hypothetical protein